MQRLFVLQLALSSVHPTHTGRGVDQPSKLCGPLKAPLKRSLNAANAREGHGVCRERKFSRLTQREILPDSVDVRERNGQ